MSHTPSCRIEYVTDEYAEKLDRFVESHDVPLDIAEQVFRDHCEELQDSLKDDTPENVIRRIAFHKLEWHPPAETTSAESGQMAAAGPDRSDQRVDSSSKHH